MMNSRSVQTIRPTRAGRRRVAFASAASLVALAGVALVPVAARADTSSTVTVVGTSDVFDSDLIQQIIKPDFEKAYPQYTLNYVSQGTGAAIAYAEAGTASALLVHAASLENQFAPTYSYEQYGRAIFYGDYVLLGPAADPAGVMSGGEPAHDIVGAFQKIAAAGQDGDANFVSRGGTPGTTVEEHQIWGLTTGVTTCPVSTASGGGAVPDQNGGACTSPALPAWYHTTGLTQGPNVVNADACNYTGGNCYVLTDRGTFQFLESEGALSNLQVVDKDPNNGAGGVNLLVNSFHAYAINPAAFTSNPNVHINLQGALAFLNWLTSSAGQKEITAYQENNPGGPSFIGDAAPTLTAAASSLSMKAGHKLTISGSLTNKVPGTPPLAGVQVTLSAKPTGGSSSAVANTTTDANGNYTIHYPPTANATYTVSSPQINQIEIPIPTLDPPFGDILQPTSTKVKGTIDVVGAPAIFSAKAHKGVVTIKGALLPTVSGSGASLRVYAGHASAASQHFVTSESLKNGATSFRVKITLHRGVTWKVRVKYVNAGHIVAGSSATKSVHVT